MPEAFLRTSHLYNCFDLELMTDNAYQRCAQDVFKEDLQKTQSETNVSKLFKAAAIMSILAFLTGAFLLGVSLL